MSLMLLLIISDVNAQRYGQFLLPGWINFQTFELESDSLICIGLESDTGGSRKHSIIFTSFQSIDSTYNVLSRFKDSLYTASSLNSSFAIRNIEDQWFLAGIADSLGLRRKATLWRFSKNYEIDTTFYLDYGWEDHSLSIEPIREKVLIGGVYTASSQDPTLSTTISCLNRRIDSAFLLNDLGCAVSYPTGCNLQLNNMVVDSDSNILLSCESIRKDYASVRDPLLIKLDKKGNEIWRFSAFNDTFINRHTHVVELCDSSYLLISNDYKYKPNRKPPFFDNSLVSTHPNSGITATKINKDGVLIKSWKWREEFFKAFSYQLGPQFAGISHLMKSNDGGYVLVGSTYALANNSNKPGFILKIDSCGRLLWYRHYILNFNGGGSYESFYPHGITELRNGGYVISGEYSSESKSVQYPNGFQSAAIVYLDEYGCQVPDCQLKDGVQTGMIGYQKIANFTSNPSYRSIELDALVPTQLQYSITNINGQVFSYGRFSDHISISIPNPGVYVVRVQENKGVFQVLKAVVQ